MSLESISHLAELTGKAPETVKRAAGELGLKPIERGVRKLYESKQILPYIYGAAEAPDLGKSQHAKTYDFNREKTLLTMRQREKVELEISEKAGDLVQTEHVVHFVTNMIANCKMRLLSIPAKLAPEAAILDDPNEIQELTREFVTEALDELRDYDGSARAGE